MDSPQDLCVLHFTKWSPDGEIPSSGPEHNPLGEVRRGTDQMVSSGDQTLEVESLGTPPKDNRTRVHVHPETHSSGMLCYRLDR